MNPDTPGLLRRCSVLGWLICALVMVPYRYVIAAVPFRAPSVSLETVSARSWQPGFHVLGRVQSADSTALVAPYTGRLEGPFRKPGMVSAGAVIARVVVPGLHAQIRAAIETANLASLELRRQRELALHGLVSQDAVDQARVRSRQSLAQLQALRRESEQTVLRAPFAGSLDYALSAGAEVYRGMTVATLRGGGQSWVRAMLTPSQVRGLDRAHAVAWHAGPLRGKARITTVGNSARDAGMIPVYADLTEPSGLLPGQWVWLQFGERSSTAYQVPDVAVVGEGGTHVVFIVKNGIAREVPVRILSRRSGSSWILGALGKQAEVAVAGAANLRDGVRVQVVQQ